MRDDISSQPILTPADAAPSSALDDMPEGLLEPVGPNEQSCCCTSRPAVRAVLPATPERDHPVDILLCGHHYRRSSARLADAGAWVFDPTGALTLESDPAA
jgi:hypothetical protein